LGYSAQVSYSLKKLILLSGHSQRQIAKHTDIPYSTINDFVRGSKNRKLSNYFKLLDYFGIDIDAELRRRVQGLANKKQPSQKDPAAEDIYTLIHSLDALHRKELLSTAVNLHKLKKNSKLTDVIDRIEKHFIKGG
jgi:transcriptional regulator with XRE-family HTH domain